MDTETVAVGAGFDSREFQVPDLRTLAQMDCQDGEALISAFRNGEQTMYRSVSRADRSREYTLVEAENARTTS